MKVLQYIYPFALSNPLAERAFWGFTDLAFQLGFIFRRIFTQIAGRWNFKRRITVR
jgi:hypothetical protein